MALGHFTLATRDVDTTARFVERTLRYRRNAVPADSPVAVAWFDIGNGQEMHLLQVDDFEMSNFEGEFGRHVALRHPASDYEALKQRLVDAGATLVDPIRPTPFARFFFREPINGYVFEIVEAPAASHLDQ